MLEEVFRRDRVRRRIRDNPIGPILERYVAYLIARGYGARAKQQYVFAAEHFGRWLGQRPVSSDTVGAFITRHLPACRCKVSATRSITCVRAALHGLLKMMGPQASAPQPDRGSSIAALLRRYTDYMIQVHGLAPLTISYRVRYARNMMAGLRIRQVRQLVGLTVNQITRYVTREGRRCRPISGKSLASSIRSFLRYLLLHKLIKRDLSVVVPGFANWRLASLPATVSTEELAKLVDTVGTTSPIGLRNRAILLCLIDLGLRASDVADLELGGVDLIGRVLHLRCRKQRRSVTVPMTKRLATSIGAYIRRGRPPGDTSAVLFARHQAPRGVALTPIGIRCVVRHYAKPAGLADRIRGTHVIRHSVASRMINAGATMKQIANLLGHRSIDTTAIYAKVDLVSLTQVAMPWPTSPEVTP
jgi:site-specific recombinase XerD